MFTTIVVAYLMTLGHMTLSQDSNLVLVQVIEVTAPREKGDHNFVTKEPEFADLERTTLIAHDLDEVVVSCKANYPIKWVASQFNLNGMGAVINGARTFKNIFDEKSYSFYSEIWFQHSKNFSGFVRCQSSLNSEVASQLHIFVPDGTTLVQNGETIKVPLPKDAKNPLIIPCLVNNPNATVKLVEIIKNSQGKEISRQPIKGTYDPKLGFTLIGHQVKAGQTFECTGGIDEHVTVEFFDPDLILNQTQTGIAFVSIQPDTLNILCENNLTTPARIVMKSLECRNPIDCDIFKYCLTQDGKCQSKIISAAPCETELCRNQFISQPHYSGLMRCTVDNSEILEYYTTGLDGRRYKLHDPIPTRALLQMDPVAPIIYTNVETFFFCEGVEFFFHKKFQFVAIINGTEKELAQGTYRLADGNDEAITNRKASGRIQDGIYVNLTKEITAITCLAPFYNSSKWHSVTSTKFIVKDVTPPKIDKSMKGKLIFYKGDKNRNLICTAQGDPIPEFKWIFNDTEIKSGGQFEISTTKEGRQSILNMKELKNSFKGTYRCIATNLIGQDQVEFFIDIQDSKINYGLVYGLTIPAAIGFIVLAIALYIMWRKYLITKIRLRNLTEQEIYEFLNGNPEEIENGGDDAQFLPFSTQWEVPPDDVIVDKKAVLGSGEFGMVVRGNYKNTTVAVKTTKATADVTYFKAFLKEVKVMAYIGSHDHIVQFLGAVTNQIRERIVYVLVELSPMGNLESYLKSHRTTYVNLVTDNKIVKQELAYENVSVRITTLDFVKWAYEVADAMNHLASKKVIHGDLATRNILLFQGLTAKISDFGLSRQLYEHTNYVKKQQVPLPWRWMAIESLKDMEFSTQSDVWSYGVTVWEIFTMAELPFPGLSWSLDFVERIENGLRMKKPKFATNEIYQIMINCWEPAPENRPNFTQLRELFYNILNSCDFEVRGTSTRAEPELCSDYCE